MFCQHLRRQFFLAILSIGCSGTSKVEAPTIKPVSGTIAGRPFSTTHAMARVTTGLPAGAPPTQTITVFMDPSTPLTCATFPPSYLEGYDIGIEIQAHDGATRSWVVFAHPRGTADGDFQILSDSASVVLLKAATVPSKGASGVEGSIGHLRLEAKAAPDTDVAGEIDYELCN